MVFIILFCHFYRHYSPRTSTIFVSEYMASLSLSFTIERALAGMRNSPIFRNGPRIWSNLLAHRNISYGSHTAKNLLDKLLSVPGGVFVSASIPPHTDRGAKIALEKPSGIQSQSVSIVSFPIRFRISNLHPAENT